MRPLTARLTGHGFQQRRIGLWQRLERVGEVTRATDDESAHGRRLHLEVALPGWGLAAEATLVFIERYVRRGDGWELTGYKYDYHREPRPSGRKAHHWHDGIVHAHCVDSRWPGAASHFRDVPVDLLEAAGDFEALHLRGDIDCSGLFPLA